ncbi:hypothetical protein ACET3Z_028861 [Daucus carota]
MEPLFRQRPGLPECQYYMKNGDCRFGLSCKYHYPAHWLASKKNCVLSHLGLPLRQGCAGLQFRHAEWILQIQSILASLIIQRLLQIPYTSFTFNDIAKCSCVLGVLGCKLDPH